MPPRLGVPIQVAQVGDDFQHPAFGLFDEKYMNALYEYGADRMRKGTAFETLSSSDSGIAQQQAVSWNRTQAPGVGFYGNLPGGVREDALGKAPLIVGLIAGLAFGLGGARLRAIEIDRTEKARRRPTARRTRAARPDRGRAARIRSE